MRKIAVVSIAADQLKYQHVGLIVFTNSDEIVDIKSWDLDRILAVQIANAARTALPVTTLTLPDVDRVALSHVYDQNGFFNPQDPNWDHVDAALRNVAAQNAADGILLLVRSAQSDSIGRSNQQLSGLGVYSRVGPRSAYASMTLYMIDGKTGKPIAGASLPTDKKMSLLNPWVPLLPQAFLPDDLADKKFSDLNATEIEQLKAIFLQLCNPSITSAALNKLLSQ